MKLDMTFLLKWKIWQIESELRYLLRSKGIAFLLFALLLPLSAMAVDGVQCRDLLMAELKTEVGKPNWKFAEPDDQSMYHATLFAHPVPNTAQGDFDADNKQDVAFLIEKAGGIRLIAVCLSSRPKTVIFINPSCSDSISILQKGHFKPDTISASCAEVTADTWLYTNGKFTMLPGDSD